MAIVAGLEPGAVLWKYSKIEQVYGWDPEKQRHDYREVVRYYVLELYSRRARTSGAYIETELYPFMDKLKIRLRKDQVYRNNDYVDIYRAIGVQNRRVHNEEQWRNLEIHEVAQRYYKRLKNSSMGIVLDRRSVFTEDAIINEMKEAAVDFEEETEWPEEPVIPINNSRASTW